MGTAGPTGATLGADNSAVGTISWSNPTNLVESDESQATAILLLSQQSHYLTATGCQFAIPLDARVLGIQVEIERSANLVSGAQDASVRLLKAGAAVGDNKAVGGTWPSSDAFQSYGGAADLWGMTWTPQEIIASDFGVALSASALLGVTCQVDFVRVTVWFLGSNRAYLGPRLKVGNGMSCADKIG